MPELRIEPLLWRMAEDGDASEQGLEAQLDGLGRMPRPLSCASVAVCLNAGEAGFKILTALSSVIELSAL